jgi:anion-transporting  ArsA/GET3 family ATPase
MPFEKRFVIVAGKGGVGRTTIAAAMATALARHGRRILLAHVRSKQHLERLLGCEEIDEQIRAIEPNLWVVNMSPEAALREKALQVLRFKAVQRAVMESRLVKYFLRAVPSLNEYSMLGKAWWHTTETVDGRPKYETVIFDGPAMGHLISMLRIPQVICDAVPGGPLVADARQVRDLLQDQERTCMCIVTLAEEMPVREALELYQAARDDLHILPARIFVNALYPEEFERPDLGEALAALRAGGSTRLGPLVAAGETLRARRLINRRYLALLGQQLPLPRVELPHLFTAQLDRAALDVLGVRIEAALPR